MRKGVIAATMVLGAASAAMAVPAGLSGVSFGVGIARKFDDKVTAENEEQTGGYVVLGVGTDFDIPDSPVSPYIDAGGSFFAAEESEAAFKIEIGVRFDVF